MIYLFSKHHSSDPFTDEELQIAARAVRASMLQSLEGSSEPHHAFSESFLVRMKALFRIDERRNRVRRTFQHAAIIVIGVFLTGALLLAFNPEARADFTRWIKSTYEKSIFYQFFSTENSNTSEESSAPLPDVEFGWLPGEYSVQKVLDEGNHIILLFEDSEETILLEYWNVDSINYTEMFMDGFVREDASVSGRSADYYQALDRDTSSTLIWTSDDGSIIFYLNASRSKNEMIKMAESIKEIKK